MASVPGDGLFASVELEEGADDPDFLDPPPTVPGGLKISVETKVYTLCKHGY